MPTLFYEFHGSENSNKEAISIVEEISKNNNGSDFNWAKNTDDRNKLWKARHDAYYSVLSQKSDIRIYSTDVCVPVSNLVECIKFAENEISKFGLRAPMVGHVGDGNFHLLVMYDPNKKDDYKMIRNLSDKLIDKALSLEGTITGEHGIGIQKKENLKKQHPDNISLMQKIKKSIYPNNIMNPGKVFDI